jgi:hypothetical protein
MAAVCSGWALVACGGSSSTEPAAQEGLNTIKAKLPAVLSATATVPRRLLENDRDDDDEAGERIGFNPHDSDIDGDNDEARVFGYYDKDDGLLRNYGHAAKGSQRRELIAFAKAYSAAAAGGEGGSACAMLTGQFAKSVPQDFGRGSAGPRYLRSASTCAQVLTGLFEHIHAQLSAPVQVMAVRVKGEQARVLIGSRTQPASYFELHRVAGAWKSVTMLAYPLL